MVVVAAPPEQRVLLENVDWDTYVKLRDANTSAGTRFTFDRGLLEIMVVSVTHESPNRSLASLVEVLLEEWDIEVFLAGSTTFRNEALAKGFEPDTCYYIQNAESVWGKKDIDLTQGPPPDLAIEIDITRSSLNRFPIFAAIGVAEVWRYDGDRVIMYSLSDGHYREIPASLQLPLLPSAKATEFVAAVGRLSRRAWLREVRAWARSVRHG